MYLIVVGLLNSVTVICGTVVELRNQLKELPTIVGYLKFDPKIGPSGAGKIGPFCLYAGIVQFEMHRGRS